jgi:hypothetical protein
MNSSAIKNTLAPIILFTYDRPWHLEQTLNALQKNELADQSQLIIYSDGGKDNRSWKRVYESRRLLNSIQGFNKITIIHHDRNKGLARNIIDGITEAINNFGKAIILEDDILTNKFFLRFMNESLDYYENRKTIWHINGWNYPIATDHLSNTFVYREMKCWGWATWKDRWNNYKKNPSELIYEFNENDIYTFNIDGEANLFQQVQANISGKINTWAIFWYATIYKNKGLCISPTQSYTDQMGFDGSGTNTGHRIGYKNQINQVRYINVFEEKLEENPLALERIKLFLIKHKYLDVNLLFSHHISILFNYIQKEIDSNDTFIIYGAGTGFQIINIFIKNIKFIIDKNASLHGQYRNGCRIISLDKLNEYDDNCSKIIISTIGRSKEIYRTLTELHGICPKRIITLDILNEC